MKKKMQVSDILILIGSIVVLIFFFLPWESDILDYIYGPLTGLGFATIVSHASGMPGFPYFIIPISAIICLILVIINIIGKWEIKNRNLILLIIAILGLLPIIQLYIEHSTYTGMYSLRFGLFITIIGLLLNLIGSISNFLKKR